MRQINYIFAITLLLSLLISSNSDGKDSYNTLKTKYYTMAKEAKYEYLLGKKYPPKKTATNEVLVFKTYKVELIRDAAQKCHSNVVELIIDLNKTDKMNKFNKRMDAQRKADTIMEAFKNQGNCKQSTNDKIKIAIYYEYNETLKEFNKPLSKPAGIKRIADGKAAAKKKKAEPRKKKAEEAKLAEEQRKIEAEKKIINFSRPNAMFLDGTYPIYNAVTKGDINTVKKLIDKGAYIDPPSTSLSSTLTSDDYLDFTGAMSPLITAIYYNHQDIAKLLIEKGADLNTVIHSSYTPLITAIHKNDLKTMVLLLRNGANPEIADARFMTPLAHALYKDNIKAAELLIKNGADVNSGTDINFDTLKPDKALFSKEMNNNRFLDQKGELLCDDDCYYLPYNTNYSCPIDSGTPLHIAVGLNNLTATELLLKNKANVNETAIVSYYSKDGKAKNFSETVINYLGRASAHNKECVDYKIMEKGNISKITELLTKKGAAAPENKINPAEIYNNKKQEIASELKAIRNQEIKGKEEQKLRTEKRRKKNTPTGKYLLIGVAIVISGGLLFLLLNSNSKK